jgi:hypothetical protein
MSGEILELALLSSVIALVALTSLLLGPGASPIGGPPVAGPCRPRRWTHPHPLGSGFEILLIGAFAGIVGYLFGNLLPTLLGATAIGGQGPRERIDAPRIERSDRSSDR